jgi:heat shock protein HslJ
MAASIENSARIRRQHVLIGLCLLSAASIAGAADRLAGSKWLVEDIGGRGVIDNLQTTLEFGADGRVGGRAGCNTWRASWDVVGVKLAIGPVATTR